MATEKTRLTFVADEDLEKRIDDFRFNHRVKNRSEAIRLLIEKGLKESEVKSK
jgi:metal-responsive CopG/Arc/MetJ family transcriptional regulator